MPDTAKTAAVAPGVRLDLAAAERFARALYEAAGLRSDIAQTVARLQVLTDAMGRRTHGLAMAPLYLAELAKGTMAKSGAPEVVQDNGHCAVWDGHYLPGLWLVDQAIQLALPRARQWGMAAVALRRSHHIGCLAALAKQAADEGLLVQIANSDPAGQRVAPYGGKQALFTPNPFAFGYPLGPGDAAEGDVSAQADNPVLVDICASITTTSMTRQKHTAGELFEHPWLLDAQGMPTRNPAVLEHEQPRGSLQLVGGAEYGHKGFGLALMIEALSQGLSGQGRADAPQRWGGNVFVQLIDPACFAGRSAFARQVDHLAVACRSNPPIDPARPVRLPGDQAAHSQRQAQQQGLLFDAATWQALAACAQTLAVPLPEPSKTPA